MCRARLTGCLLFILASVGLTACVTSRPMHLRSSALEYLYPEGTPPLAPPGDVKLSVPVRVGLAFAPKSSEADPFSEVQKQRLLERIAASFREKEFIASLEAIPSTYLSKGGSFAELDRLATAFGVDLMAMVSYDQRQVTESTNASWTYLTVIGAFIVRGEKNETRTLMDTVVYDIPSRTLLFRAGGESSVAGSATPVEVERKLRLASEEGFEAATDDLIGKLDVALEAFREQAKTGTVRGAGTPAVQVVDASGAVVRGGGAGALGLVDLVAAAALAGTLWAGRRRRVARR